MNRRVVTIFVVVVSLLFTFSIAIAQQTLLPGMSIPKFVEPLPVAGAISVVDATSAGLNGAIFPIAAEEFQAQILPTLANWPTAPATCADGTASWTWGYLTTGDDKTVIRPSYLGPVVIAERKVPAYPMFINNLPSISVVEQNLPIDMTLDWANPDGTSCLPDLVTGNYTNPACGILPSYIGAIPIATHLHGGEVAPAFDGGPDAWFTPGYAQTGKGFPGAVYEYLNDQQESTIWFHDHALGITRLNVYAGLAGAYPIIDPDNGPQVQMPAFPQHDIPLIIQDRSFDTNCQIFYNLASNPQPNPTVHPFWIPEFIGDTIVVNGKTWPYLNVEKRQYRFRFINGSNARFYNLSLDKNLKFVVIATDDGYLANAFETPTLIIGPGERYEVIVDFSKAKAKKNAPPGYVDVVTMLNAAPTPFPAGAPVIVGLTDTVMQFRLSLGTPASDIPSIVNGTPIRAASSPIYPIVNGHVPATGSITRQLTLNEVIGKGGPLELVVNNSKFNRENILPGCPTPYCRETELPAVGDTEIWEIINITADAHPMHTHLTSFQILDRTPFRASSWIGQYDSLMKSNGVLPGEGPPNQYNVKNADGAIGGNPAIGAFLSLKNRRLPLPYEMGWKDTVIAYPGEVTRIAVRWAPTDVPVATPATCSSAPGTAGCAGVNSYPFDPSALAGNPDDPTPGVGYVWHCHIIDHEDNEMMRNYVVGTARQTVCTTPTTCP
jgi:spore coat protein A